MTNPLDPSPRKHPQTNDDYLALLQREFHELGHLRLVIPLWLAEREGFTELFNSWVSKLAVCGANYRDPDTFEQRVCMDLPNHPDGQHFGESAEVEQSQGIERAQ